MVRDPFGETGARLLRWRACVLGARLEFSSNSRELLAIAREAFARQPQHRWPRGAPPTLRVNFKLVPEDSAAKRALPPKPGLSSGAGLLCAHIDSQNFAVVDPAGGRALVQVGESTLRHRQLVRYELVEFAAITLATRAQGLVPLHGGCVGARGRGVLLLGSSGSGKSTLALHAALDGLEFLAEDSVFVHPTTMCATGLSAYVHARGDAVKLIRDQRARHAVGRAPRIQRRSGVRKHEVDLRHGLVRLAHAPMQIVATVVLSARRARGTASLAPLTAQQLRRELRAEQPYAAGQPGWQEFERRVLRAGGFRLDRMPLADGVSSLRKLLEEHKA